MSNLNQAQSGGAIPPYNVVPLTRDAFNASCPLKIPARSVQVPQYKHILHRQPVIFETTTEEVSYIDVPVQHFYEERDYNQRVQTQCTGLLQAEVKTQSAGGCFM